ncbi:DUF1998 domain-containing protein [Hydrogenimonas urashimensis]|uniref:DUF1998 domain-containing protein n=1 Tax=Hydrogenimonas urashimensis TaxID=2740515 RepID=UPI0019158D57|nr:DUF1998 domain-containing protein [Hydrogenimonas urashimensis]
MADRYVVGSIRPSQLLWTYGPGAMIDLPNLSVVTMGLDHWDVGRCERVEEARLLSIVRRTLGPQVKNLFLPPIPENEEADPFSAEAKVGVPVLVFPRWLRCVKCGTLATVDSGLFKVRTNPYRPDTTHYEHVTCDKNRGRPAPAVPTRFMLACRAGHLDDFPWHWFVHDGPSDCRGVLKFYETGASLQTENLWVECKTCGKKKSMARAFGKAGVNNLPACRGRHPHLHMFDGDCEEEAKAILLGASNAWFPTTVSVLAIPLEESLDQFVEDGWDYFEDVEDEAELKVVLKTLKKANKLHGIEKYDLEELWKAIERKRKGETTSVKEEDVKRPEWKVLTSSEPPKDWPHFLAEEVGPPKGFESEFRSVLQLKRLREVVALVGFTRIEALDEAVEEEERPPSAPLSRTAPEWVPVSEVHGEGIFLRFDEEAVKRWEERTAVRERDESLRKGHVGWRNARGLDPSIGYPGARYVMIHTFAHLLIRELALECGYNSASLRERIYADEGMAGVLIYTAAPDSDGTLGGLVELAEPEALGRTIRQALERAKVCASDPLCAEHEPDRDATTHGAACHACVFVSETSCERGNRHVDRAFVVETYATKGTAFFDESSR